MEKYKKQRNSDDNILVTTAAAAAASANATATPIGKASNFLKKQRQDWEIEPSKLVIKSVIARGTFGTVHRGLYDGHDVAG